MIDLNSYDQPVTRGDVGEVVAVVGGAYVGHGFRVRFAQRRAQGLPYNFADVVCRGLGILFMLLVLYVGVAIVWALADGATQAKPMTVCNNSVIQFADGTLRCDSYDPTDPYSYMPPGAHYVPGLHSVPLNQ